jgi:hypothetical protein
VGTLTVREAFTPGAFQVTEGAICPDITPAAITAVTLAEGGDGQYEYQWYENGTLISGATAATYQPVSYPAASPTVVFTRTAKDNTCNTTPTAVGSYTLTVSATVTPTINIMPAVQEVCKGSNFTVTSGTLTGGAYKWFELRGASWTARTETTSAITLPGTLTGDHYYKVEVSSSDASACGGTYTSAPAMVTVRKTFTPGGVVAGASGAICAGITPTAITEVIAPDGGDGQYEYQWYAGGTEINGATAATYQPGTYSNNTTVLFERGVKDGCATTFTKGTGGYTLTVNETVTPTTSLTPAVHDMCGAASFTITASKPAGEASANAYEWYSSANGTDWTPVADQHSQTLTVDAATAAVNKYYKVEVLVQGACAKSLAVSAPATITVREAFTPGKFMVDTGAVCLGMTPQAITAVSNPSGGSGSYTYQWYADNVKILGATASTYQPAKFAASATVRYTREVTDKLCGVAQTDGAFTLKAGIPNAIPTINITPASLSTCERVTLTAGEVVGATNPTYTWEVSHNNLNWTTLSISGKTVNMDTTGGDYFYRVKIVTGSTNTACATVVSAPATVTVSPLSGGSFIPGMNTGRTCVNTLPAAIGEGNVTPATGGDGKYTYTWYITDEGGTRQVDGDHTSATYQPQAFSSPKTVHYTRVVHNSCKATIESATGSYTLTVDNSGVQTTNLAPSTQSVCEDADFTIKATALADAYPDGYTWETSDDGSTWKEVTETPRPTGAVLNVSTQQPAGTHYYRVTAVSAGTCAPVITATPATVTVYASAFTPGSFTNGTASVTSGTVCMHVLPDSFEVSDPEGGSGSFTFQWYKNNQLIPGATDARYKPVPEDVAQGGAYKFTRKVADARSCNNLDNGQWTAGTYQLEVNQTANVSLTPPTIPQLCYGASFTLSASTFGNAASYTWEIKGNSAITITDANTLSVGSVTAPMSSYRAVVYLHGSDCPSVSDWVDVHVSPEFSAGVIADATDIICSGGAPATIQPSAEDTGNGNTYQWYYYTAPGGALTAAPGSATAATYTPDISGLGTGTYYFVRKVTDGCKGTQQYSTGTHTLRVLPVPNVSVDNVNACVTWPAAVPLTATVSGDYATTTASYIWQYYSNGAWADVQNGTPSGAVYIGNNSQLMVRNITLSDPTKAALHLYRVVTSGLPGCDVTSNAATLTVHPQPQAGSTLHVSARGPVCATTPVTLRLDGTVVGTIFEWEVTDPDGQLTPVAGSSTSTIVAPDKEGTWTYRVKVSNEGCTTGAFSPEGEVVVRYAGKGGAIILAGDKTDTYLCADDSRTMKVTGADGDVFEWERSVDGKPFQFDYDTDSTHAVSSLPGGHTYSYRLSVGLSGCNNRVYSDTMVLKVYDKNRIQGGNLVVAGSNKPVEMCYGGNVTVELRGHIGEPTDWIYSADGSSSTYTLSDATKGATTYSLSSLLQGTYHISVVIDNGCATVTSAPIKVVVKEPIAVTLEGRNAQTAFAACKGEELVLTILEDGAKISNAGTWTGVITSVSAGASTTVSGTGPNWRVNTSAVTGGSYTYRVTYANSVCTAQPSNTVTVSYNTNVPAAGTLTPLMEFCSTDQTSQTLTLTGNSATIVRWEYKNLATTPEEGGWQTIPNNTSYEYGVFPEIFNGNPGTFSYRVVVSDINASCQTGYSNEAQVIKYPLPVLEREGATYDPACGKAAVDLTFTGSNKETTFVWEKKIDNHASSVTTGTGSVIKETLSYTGNGTSPQTVTYTVTPKLGKCAGTSKTFTYHLLPNYEVIFDENASSVAVNCDGDTTGVLVYNTKAGSATFTLSLNNKTIGTQAGATARFEGLGVGVYTLTADNGTCTVSYTKEITSNIEPLRLSNKFNDKVLCYGESTGAISFNVEGGTQGVYTASINNGAPVSSIDAFTFPGLAAGTYTVKVVDVISKCVLHDTVAVAQNEKLTLNVTAVTPVTAADAHDASATLQATGGESPYLYSATGLVNDFAANTVVEGLAEGLNYVYAKDVNNCTASIPLQIGSYPADGSTVTLSLTAKVTKPLTCDAAADAEITVTVIGNSSNYKAKVNGRPDQHFGGNTGILPGFGAGVHTITVEDGATPPHAVSMEVTVDPVTPPAFTAVITKYVSAAGEDDAEVTLNITGNPADFKYSKNDVWGTKNVFGNLAAGAYNFSVRKGSACEATPVYVIIPPYSTSQTPLTAMASITRALTCDGDAQITVTAAGGDNLYNFGIDSGTGIAWGGSYSSVAQHVYTVAAGTYNLYVRDYASTVSGISIPVAAVSKPVIGTVASTATSCGGHNGSIAVTATGTGALQYSLSGVQWSSSSYFTNVSAGSYTVFVKDSRGCSASSITSVGRSEPVTFDITEVIPARDNNGTVTEGKIALFITGGVTPYTATLDTIGRIGAMYSATITTTPHDISPVKAGAYRVSVRDNNGCTATPQGVVVGMIDKDGKESLSLSYKAQDPKCSAEGGKITVTAKGGTGTYTYSLGGGAYNTSNVFSDLPAGTYTVQVKDNDTLPQQATVEVVLNGAEALNYTVAIIKELSAKDASDAEILVVGQGGTPPYIQYTLTGKSPSADGRFSGLGAGTYEVGVEDNNGCKTTGQLNITAPDKPGETAPPAISARVVRDPACFGGNNGAVAVTAIGGRSPYVYAVDTVNWTGNTILTGLSAGTYTVYVKELALGRITQGPKVVLHNPVPLKARIEDIKAASAGAADGVITLTAEGGSKPYQYALDGQNSYQYGNVFAGLPAKAYTFHVKDGKGCGASVNAVLAEEGKISISAEVTKPVSCYGGNDAEVTVGVWGGTAPYSYHVGDAERPGHILTGLSGGTYGIYVTDSNRNSASVTVFIAQPKELEVTARVTALPTAGAHNGAILVVASGGSGNYTYEVNNTASALPSVSGLGAGIHQVKVADANGCFKQTSIKLATVDVIISKTVINLNKDHSAETYTIRLSERPKATVTVQVTDPKGLVTLTPSEVTFTPDNWGVRQVTATINLPAIDSPLGGLSYYTTKVKNTVTSGGDYEGIIREVIVNITDDGTLDCAGFDSQQPVIALDGQPIDGNKPVCISDERMLSVLSVTGGTRYSWWLEGYFPEISTEPSFRLPQSGTYMVTVWQGDRCKVVSAPVAVDVKAALTVPYIKGPKVVKEGENRIYKVANASNDVQYTWIIPQGEGYERYSGSTTDSEIMITIGKTSSLLRVQAVDPDSACSGVEGRLNLEVRTSYAVNVYPTVVTGNTPLKIAPKNMVINNIAIINTVGESYAYKVLSGSFPLESGNDNSSEMQIEVSGLPSGHYFIVFYGQEQTGNTYHGRKVVHTERIVIKN